MPAWSHFVHFLLPSLSSLPSALLLLPPPPPRAPSAPVAARAWPLAGGVSPGVRFHGCAHRLTGSWSETFPDLLVPAPWSVFAAPRYFGTAGRWHHEPLRPSRFVAPWSRSSPLPTVTVLISRLVSGAQSSDVALFLSSWSAYAVCSPGLEVSRAFSVADKVLVPPDPPRGLPIAHFAAHPVLSTCRSHCDGQFVYLCTPSLAAPRSLTSLFPLSSPSVLSPQLADIVAHCHARPASVRSSPADQKVWSSL